MNRAKLKLGFVFILIMLSFFSFNLTCYADNPSSIGPTGGTAKTTGNDGWVFTCTQTGVYEIKMLDSNQKSSQEWYIKEDGPGGGDLRLACYQTKDPTTGETYYQLYSPIDSTDDTSCKVILLEGQQYRITAPTNDPNDVNTAIINYYPSDNKLDYKQSDFDSAARTKVNNGGYEGHMEPMQEEYKPSVSPTSQGEDGEASGPNYRYSQSKEEKPVAGAFQKAVVRLLLSLGDYFVKLLNDIVGSDVTISNLIFNKVETVNPNFYDGNNAGLAHIEIKEAISTWYTFFRRIAISIYVIAVLGIGIRVLLNSTAKGIQEAKSLFVEWMKGVIYLLLMPYGIWLLFKINETLVQEICQASAVSDYKVGSSFTDGSEWSVEDIEYRSPEYVSKYTGLRGFGTDSANGYYMKKVNDYAANFDLMRIVRAYAGATFLLSYTIIWYILIGQLLTFIYIYYKRYFMISFFIAIFPIMCIFQAIGIIKDGRSRAVSGWLGELISNIFTQFIHALIYTIITVLVVNLLNESLTSGLPTNELDGFVSVTTHTLPLVNWILIIVAINFVPQGEKMLRKILKALSQGSSAEGLGEGGLRKGVGALRTGVKQIIGH